MDEEGRSTYSWIGKERDGLQSHHLRYDLLGDAKDPVGVKVGESGKEGRGGEGRSEMEGGGRKVSSSVPPSFLISSCQPPFISTVQRELRSEMRTCC